MNMTAVIMREPWKPSDGDTKCQKCFGLNPVWYCDSLMWNTVMGNDGGILCPTCFMLKAQAAGSCTLWEVACRKPGDLVPAEQVALQELREDREGSGR